MTNAQATPRYWFMGHLLWTIGITRPWQTGRRRVFQSPPFTARKTAEAPLQQATTESA
jgi:hypothetical protein